MKRKLKKPFKPMVEVSRIIRDLGGCRLSDAKEVRATFSNEESAVSAVERINKTKGWRANLHPDVKNMIQMTPLD